MGVRTTLLAVLAAAAVSPAAAQTNPAYNPFAPPASSTGTAVSASTTSAYMSQMGAPLSINGGPWVLGEVLFFSEGKVVSDYAWRDKVRGQRGRLYAAADLQDDAQSLISLNVFTRVTPAVYQIPNSPIPPEFATIAVSTSQVRVVFDVAIKQSTATVKPHLVTPPSAVSGLILTPTAFRGAGKYNTPGLGLDINAAYFIGRLYGKNSYPDALSHTDYITRIGLWALSADGKMQLQSDGPWRPAVAVGGQATFLFRDSPQPTVNTPSVSVSVKAKTTQILTDAYVVASKNFRGVRASAGLMQGDFGNIVASLSDYLTPEALQYYNREPAGTVASSHTVPFVSLFYLLKPDYPIGFEAMKFNGSPGDPYLIDFKLGRFLHLNFDVAVLKFSGGYDVLGLLQFRYNHFPNK